MTSIRSGLSRLIHSVVHPAHPAPARAPQRPVAAPADSFTPAPVRAPAAPASPVTDADRAQVTSAYAAQLGRAPTADELAKGADLASQQRLAGRSADDVNAFLRFLVALSPEWQAKSAYQDRLGRAPTADELQKSIAWGTQLQAEGKSVPEMRAAFDFVLAMTPEWQATSAYQDRLGRAPTADELQKSIAWGNQLQAEGKSVPEVRAAFDFVLAMTPEWQARDAYQAGLGRLPSADELQRAIGFGNQLQAEGKSVPEMRAAFDFVIALSPEWQDLHHSKLNTNRDEIYLQQPNGWSCGPTSLSMALAASGVRPANGDTINEMIDALGARAGVGTPGGPSLIADVARRFGVNAEASGSTDPADARAALERGHGVVVNGDLGGGGHFLYLAGLDENGDYIVCDPWRPGITRWNDGDLYAFTHHGNNPPGFAEIWPG